MKLTLTEQLLYAIEQRIAKIISYKEEYGLDSPSSQDPYLWYVNQSSSTFVKYTVDCLKEVPVHYESKRGYIVDFKSEDTVHTAFLKIVNVTIQFEHEGGVIDGILYLQDGSQRHLELDLTGN